MSRPKGFVMTEEHKRKISLAQKGRTLKEEHRLKLSAAHKGVKLGENHRKRIGEGGRGIKKPFSETHKKNLSVAHIGVNAKDKHPNWKGGISPANMVIRGSLEYKLWRKSVFSRDNHTCQVCNIRNKVGVKVKLNAHHIKPFAWFPELRFAIDNGVTLCADCHKNKHKKS